MQNQKLPKLAFKQKPVEKRNRGHPKKRWKIISWKRVEGHRLNKPN
jgi:hypothetical protein